MIENMSPRPRYPTIPNLGIKMKNMKVKVGDLKLSCCMYPKICLHKLAHWKERICWEDQFVLCGQCKILSTMYTM